MVGSCGLRRIIRSIRLAERLLPCWAELRTGGFRWKRADGQTLSKVKRVSRDAQIPLLDDAKRQEIIARHQQLLNEGKLPTQQRLDKEYALFREHFGPSVLAGLDGEPLLILDARPQQAG